MLISPFRENSELSDFKKKGVSLFFIQSRWFMRWFTKKWNCIDPSVNTIINYFTSGIFPAGTSWMAPPVQGGIKGFFYVVINYTFDVTKDIIVIYYYPIS